MPTTLGRLLGPDIRADPAPASGPAARHRIISASPYDIPAPAHQNVTMPLRVALLGVGVALGLWARALAASSRLSFASRTSWGTIFLLIAGWSAMVAAVIVLRERRRCALLLYAVGSWWFVRELASPSVEFPLAFTIGLLLFPLGPALVTHLLLSHPAGRIEGWPYRVIVASGYVVTAGVLGLAGTSFFDPEPMGCVGCPDNLLLIHAEPGLYDRLNLTGVQLGAAWLILALGAGAWRVISAKPGSRSSISLVAAGAIGFLTASAAYYLTSLTAGALGGNGRGFAIWQAQGACLILLAVAMIGDLWRVRRARRNLTRLVVDLAGPAPGRLRDALAQRLADPSLVIGYPIEDGGRYVDAEAREVRLPPPGGRAVTSLRRGSSELAILVHRPGILGSQPLVDDLVASVQLGLENERLTAEDLAQLDDLRSSGSRIVAAGDTERRRIERNLHDGAQQRMVALLLSLRLIRTGPGGGAPQLEAAEQRLRQAIADLRRVAQGVHPVLLKEAGLRPALDALGEERPITVQAAPGRRYPDAIESSVYLVVARMSAAGATSVVINDDGSHLTTRVTVNGHPSDLLDLTDRAKTLGGDIEITDTGDEVVATLTLPSRQSSG
jgi:signal transduction histidine kinase